MKRGSHEMSSTSEVKVDRKIIEKNRRIQMKALCSTLVSIIPDQYFTPAKEFLSQPDQLQQSVDYIKILRDRVEDLRRKKTEIISNTNISTNYINAAKMGESKLPILNIRNTGSELEVVLISGTNKKLSCHKMISIIEQEEAEVITVGISTVGNEVFYTIHAQIKFPRIGVDISRISEKIHHYLVSIMS